MKNGIARRVKLVVEAYILCGSIVRNALSPRAVKNVMAVRPKATAMGRLIITNARRTTKIKIVSMESP